MSNSTTPSGVELRDSALRQSVGSSQQFNTLGSVLDGYLRLSDEEKLIFQLAAGLQQKVGSASPSAAPAAAASAGALGAAQPLPPGHTRDPKTGKVYKLVPKKDKTEARKGLENGLAQAKRELSEFIRQHNVTLGDNRNPLPGSLDAERAAEFHRRKAVVESAKRTLSQYKLAHPEEFAPPPTKKGGKAPTGAYTVTSVTGGASAS